MVRTSVRREVLGPDKMRDQYAGDVSDVLKFSFLRAVAGADRRLGIGWYYVPGHDGRTDGRHLEWREAPAWYRLDPRVHQGLAALPERTVAALEAAPIWPERTLFHREPVEQKVRGGWADGMRRALADANMIFLDPDNGIGEKGPKHARLSEIDALRGMGRTIAFIAFPGRNARHEDLVKQLHCDLSAKTAATEIFTLRTSVSVPSRKNPSRFVPRTRWFTCLDFDERILERARAFLDAVNRIPRVKARLDVSV